MIERLDRDGAGEEVMHRAGLALDSYFSASKLAWIMNHIPEARSTANTGEAQTGYHGCIFPGPIGRGIQD